MSPSMNRPAATSIRPDHGAFPVRRHPKRTKISAEPRDRADRTDPTTAAPGTIRGDLGRDWGLKVQQNLVHGSDSPESAARELGIWF